MPFVEFDERENLSPLKKALYFVWDLLKVVVVSLLIILPVRYWLIQPFYVKGASMEPTFYDHEYLIINEIGYRFGEPERGDVVVFKYPKDPAQYFIKRVIGLPGEKLEVSDNHIYIYPAGAKNKFLLDESAYLSVATDTVGNATWSLGNGQYFVMGDNREYSLDSRSFGPVSGELIIGQVWLRGWPITRAAVFGGIEYPSVIN